jgi:hypothetical protein
VSTTETLSDESGASGKMLQLEEENDRQGAKHAQRSVSSTILQGLCRLTNAFLSSMTWEAGRRSRNNWDDRRRR